MKNLFGQEIAIGSVVGVGYRRSHSAEHALGVVVHMWPVPYTHTTWTPPEKYGEPWGREDETREYMFAKVRWVIARNGNAFTSHWNINDLILVDDRGLDVGYALLLDKAYEAFMFDNKAPSDFIPS
ncbi:hypothetical protein SEA_NANOSMITE_55 [Mycobacterium phage Nanosmite]|nr:hypothetical protein SEA_NANOSMITE_55 [Mycobacterium phage Nanosmite]